MKRRAVALLCLVLLTAPLDAEAQSAGRIPRIGYIIRGPTIADFLRDNKTFPAFLDALAELGYVDGRTMILDLRPYDGLERIPEVVAELVRLKVDVIVASNGAAALRVKQATSTVPIVFATAATPVEVGLVQSLARPGGNVTGLSVDVGPENEGKRLALLRESFPGISRVAFIGAKTDWDHPAGRATQAAARTLGLTLVRAEYAPPDYSTALAVVTRKKIDALYWLRAHRIGISAGTRRFCGTASASGNALFPGLR